jgi:cold shock CspA family protein
MEGTMLWFNPAKRHGFIDTDSGERLRVDEEGLAAGQTFADRCSGTRVTFDRITLATSSEEARAVNVTIVPQAVGRRARRRGRS